MDWGFARPFSVGWWAVVAEPTPIEGGTLPRGCLVRYREWYGASAPNTGLRLTAEQVAEGIKHRERGETIAMGVLDPSAFAHDGGPSIAEKMATSHKVMFRRADNTRVAKRGSISGWDAVRTRLKGDEDGPMLAVFSTCVDTIRTLPVLQHDPLKPEDLDTEGEDHAADEIRYACLSRPWIPRTVQQEKGKTLREMTMNDLWKAQRPAEKRI